MCGVGCSTLEEVQSSTEEKNAVPLHRFMTLNGKGFASGWCYRSLNAIDQQLLYTVGQLNHYNSVGRLDQVEILEHEWEEIDTVVESHTALKYPLLGARQVVPTSYTLILPSDVGWDALDAFVEKYTDTCLKWRATDVDSGVFWYYFRPNPLRVDEEIDFN